MSFSDLNECKKVNGEFNMRFEYIGLDNSPALIVFIGFSCSPPLAPTIKNNTAKINVSKEFENDFILWIIKSELKSECFISKCIWNPVRINNGQYVTKYEGKIWIVSLPRKRRSMKSEVTLFWLNWKNSMSILLIIIKGMLTIQKRKFIDLWYHFLIRKLVGKKIKRNTIEFIYKRIDRSYLNDSRNTKNKEESSLEIKEKLFIKKQTLDIKYIDNSKNIFFVKFLKKYINTIKYRLNNFV